MQKYSYSSKFFTLCLLRSKNFNIFYGDYMWQTKTVWSIMGIWKENQSWFLKFFLQIQIWTLPFALVCSHLHLHLFSKAQTKGVTLTYLSEKDGNTGQGPEHKTDVLYITEISWVSTSAFNFLLWIRWRNKDGASHTSEQSAKQPRKTSDLQETSHYLKLTSLQQK